jgi:EAL and modified HD-GYP domain-containing signal transduction protein
MRMHDVFVARQPIFDRQLKVYAYELLFRRADAQHANVIDGDQATSQVILNAFTVIGLDELVGPHLAFINMTRGFLLQDRRVPFPVDRVVLEVLESIEPDAEVVLALQDLSRQGYKLSLDDFIFNEALLPLVELADIIKVDVMALTPAQIRRHVEQLRPYKVQLLAEKVETRAQYELCHQLGFDYFQGYFLERPNVVRGTSIPTNRLPTLNLLAALHRPDVEVAELERIISQDVSLSYKLLRYLNSPLFALRRRIESIRQALIFIGANELRTWATLMALSTASDKPQELMSQLMVRGKMCELLARKLKLKTPANCFTIGLFSGLDSLLDAPLETILASLPLSDEVTAALLRHEGDGGRLLECVLSYEHGEWDRLAQTKLPAEVVIEAYLEALHWGNELRASW